MGNALLPRAYAIGCFMSHLQRLEFACIVTHTKRYRAIKKAVEAIVELQGQSYKTASTAVKWFYRLHHAHTWVRHCWHWWVFLFFVGDYAFGGEEHTCD